MSDSKISALGSAAALTGSELAVLVQTGQANNVVATLQTILALLATLGVKNLTIGPPAAGVALTVDGLAGSDVADFVGASGTVSVSSSGAQIAFSYNGVNILSAPGAGASFQFSVNGVNRGSIAAGGNWTFAAPTSGVTATIAGLNGSGNYAAVIQGGTTGGDRGLKVQGGTNAADFGLVVTNAAGSANLLQVTVGNGAVFGQGIGLFGGSAPAQSTGWGTPTGAGVVNNFAGSAATLASTGQAVAQIIIALKALGLLAA
jgi:hypothetical protein